MCDKLCSGENLARIYSRSSATKSLFQPLSSQDATPSTRIEGRPDPTCLPSTWPRDHRSPPRSPQVQVQMLSICQESLSPDSYPNTDRLIFLIKKLFKRTASPERFLQGSCADPAFLLSNRHGECSPDGQNRQTKT